MVTNVKTFAFQRKRLSTRRSTYLLKLGKLKVLLNVTKIKRGVGKSSTYIKAIMP